MLGELSQPFSESASSLLPRKDFTTEVKLEATPKKGSVQYKDLEYFSKEVEIILQTTSKNEFDVVTSFMGPPKNFTEAVIFPTVGKIVGMFANQKIALIQNGTDEFKDNVLNIHHTFPNARYIIGIGACFSLDKEKNISLGDVLVSEQIGDIDSLLFNAHGKVVKKEEIISVDSTLKSLFCSTLVFEKKFPVSTILRNSTEKSEKTEITRYSKVYAGKYISYDALLNFTTDHNNFEKYRQTTTSGMQIIGGDRECGELVKIYKAKKVDGIIMIKGVADYGMEKIRNRYYLKWEKIAVEAATRFVQSRLQFYECDYPCK